MRFPARRSPILFLSSLLVLGMVSSVHPQQLTQEEELQQRIAQLQQEMADAERRAAQLSQDESRQAELLQELGTQISASEQLINALTRQIRSSSAEAEQLQEEIAALSDDIDVLSEAVAAYVVGLYKHGRRRSLEIILGGESFSEAMKRFKGVSILATRQREDVDRLGEVRDLRIGKRADVTRTLNQQQQSRTEQRATRNTLRDRREQVEQLLGEIASDRARLEEFQREASNALTELTQELQEMIRRRRERGIGSNIALGGFGEMQGRLPWPISSPSGPGTIVRGFGRQRGRDNTVTITPGIDILAPGANTSIIAVHNAEVIHIGWLNFLGTVIILDHGDDYATVYTNAINLAVEVNDPVYGGFPMAHVGTEMPPVADEEAGHLMRFMISISGDSVDPAPWLGGAR